jgi:hypothetical protein
VSGNKKTRPPVWLRARLDCSGVDAWANRSSVPLGPGGPVFASRSAVSLARGLSALSPFRWELAERERFRRLKDDLHTAGETFCAKSAIVLLLILSNAHSAKTYGTDPRDWAGRPPKYRRVYFPALLRFVNPAIRGYGVTVCAIAFLHN